MSSWIESCRTRLPEHLDEQGDLAPPWEKFPAYERYTIGWRMGYGEDWLGLWSAFLEGLTTIEERWAYLERHRPAPLSWANSVWNTLHVGSEPVHDLEPMQLQMLYEQSLVGLDVAYQTWSAQQSESPWHPWTHNDTPEHAARYPTREFWFWGRHMTELSSRAHPLELPPMEDIPELWHELLASQKPDAGSPSYETSEGLECLAKMCVQGKILPPWRLGCSQSDFTESFEMDMGYVDAFHLWCYCAFDDLPTARQLIGDVPESWQAWITEYVHDGLADLPRKL